MREALAIVAEEGLESTWKRHRDMHNLLWDGLGKLGLSPLVKEGSHRLASVNAIEVSSCCACVTAQVVSMSVLAEAGAA